MPYAPGVNDYELPEVKYFAVYPDGREEELDQMDAMCFRQQIDLDQIDAKVKMVVVESGYTSFYPSEQPPKPSVEFESEEARQEFWQFQANLAKFIETSDTATFISFLMKK